MTVNELIGKLNALPEEQKEMEVRFCEIVETDTQVNCNFLNFADCKVFEFMNRVLICLVN